MIVSLSVDDRHLRGGRREIGRRNLPLCDGSTTRDRRELCNPEFLRRSSGGGRDLASRNALKDRSEYFFRDSSARRLEDKSRTEQSEEMNSFGTDLGKLIRSYFEEVSLIRRRSTNWELI